MQGALIGFGTIALGHLAAYQQVRDLSIVAIVDPCSKRLEQAAAKYPTVRTYENVDALMANEDIDFIDVCSPPHTHLECVRIGLMNNCHILCEKPLFLSVRDYKGILSLITKANRVLYPCHNYKFAPILKLIKNTAQSDNFGRIISGHFRTLRSGHAVGVPEWNPHWRRDFPISGGGILRDHGTHSIYLACHICKQLPTAVSCLTGNLRTDDYYETEDTTLLTLRFNDDMRFNIDLSWAASFRNSYYAVYGTSESMIIENDEFSHLTKEGELIRRSFASEFDDPSHKVWFIDVFEDFKEVVATPDRQLPLLQEALVTSLVVEGAYESAKKNGGLVKVPYPSDDFM